MIDNKLLKLLAQNEPDHQNDAAILFTGLHLLVCCHKICENYRFDKNAFQYIIKVARCTKIINADSDDPKYIINVKQFAKFVVDLGDQVAPTDIEEGMRVGVDRNKYQIHIPLPPKIDPTVTMMQVCALFLSYLRFFESVSINIMMNLKTGLFHI